MAAATIETKVNDAELEVETARRAVRRAAIAAEINRAPGTADQLNKLADELRGIKDEVAATVGAS